MKYAGYVFGLLLVCYTLNDVQNEGCRALCERDGYDNGKYAKEKCICYANQGTYEDFKHKRISVPNGRGIDALPDAPPVIEKRDFTY
jgi:hypothetical protein